MIPQIAALLPEDASEPDPGLDLAEQRRAASRSQKRLRTIVAVTAAAIVPATFALARVLLPPAWALAAAWFSATSLLHVSFSTQARPHASAAALSALAVAALVALVKKSSVPRWVGVALASAAAIGTLQSGLAVLPPLFLAILLRLRADRARAVPFALICMVVLGLAIRWLYPFWFSGGSGGATHLEFGDGTIQQAGHRVELNRFRGQGFLSIVQTLWSYDPLLLGLAPAGLVAAFLASRNAGARRDPAGWILCAHAVPYLLAIGLYYRTYERLVAPLVPYLSIASAALLACGTNLQAPYRALARVLTLIALLLPLWNAIELARLRGRSDTTVQLADWIEAESPGEQDLIYLSDGLDVPLFYARNDLGQNRRQLIGIRTYPWFRYQDRIPFDSLMGKAYPLRFLPFRDGDFFEAFERDPGAALLSLKPRYVAVVQFYTGEIPQHRSAVRAACVALAERVEVFSPCGRGIPPGSPLTYQDSRVSPKDPIFLRIHRAQALGPVIEVFRFER